MNGTPFHLATVHASARRETLLAEATRTRTRNHAASPTAGTIRRRLGSLRVATGARLHGPASQPIAQPAG